MPFKFLLVGNKNKSHLLTRFSATFGQCNLITFCHCYGCTAVIQFFFHSSELRLKKIELKKWCHLDQTIVAAKMDTNSDCALVRNHHFFHSRIHPYFNWISCAKLLKTDSCYQKKKLRYDQFRPKIINHNQK